MLRHDVWQRANAVLCVGHRTPRGAGHGRLGNAGRTGRRSLLPVARRAPGHGPRAGAIAPVAGAVKHTSSLGIVFNRYSCNASRAITLTSTSTPRPSTRRAPSLKKPRAFSSCKWGASTKNRSARTPIGAASWHLALS